MPLVTTIPRAYFYFQLLQIAFNGDLGPQLALLPIVLIPADPFLFGDDNESPPNEIGQPDIQPLVSLPSLFN